MFEAMELKLGHYGPLPWHHLHTKLYPVPLIGSKVISEGHTNRLMILQASSTFWKVG
jgi:hypothetical protein